MASAKSRTPVEIVLVKGAGLGGGRSPVDNTVGNLLGAVRIAADREHDPIKVVRGGSIDIELGGFRNHFHQGVAAGKTHGEAPRIKGPETRQTIGRGKSLA